MLEFFHFKGSKSEIRINEFAASSGEYNPMGIQNTNAPMFKTETKRLRVLVI